MGLMEFGILCLIAMAVVAGIMILVLYSKPRRKNKPWVYHDWHGIDTPEQQRAIQSLVKRIESGEIKTHSLKEHINKRK